MTGSIEASYYENEDFWKPAAFSQEDIDRLDFVAARVPLGVDSLLDAGCGNGMFLEHLARSRPEISRLCGAERSRTALAYVKTEKVEASIDSLPFADRSFDCVSSLEVIEHLPVDVYRRALKEIARIARTHILISVPNNQDLTIGQVRCPSCATRFSPDYHFRSYDAKSIRRIFEDRGFTARSVEPYGKSQEYLFSATILRLKGDKENRFEQQIPCPACGHVLEGRPATGGASTANAQGAVGGLKSLVKSIWPKVVHDRWLLVHFTRSAES